MKNMDVGEFLKKSEEVAVLLKTLGHPKRLQIVCFLQSGEKSVSEIESFCQISQSQISNFLKRMSDEQLLEKRKDGNHILYRIKDPKVLELVQSLEKIFC